MDFTDFKGYDNQVIKKISAKNIKIARKKGKIVLNKTVNDIQNDTGNDKIIGDITKISKILK